MGLFIDEFLLSTRFCDQLTVFLKEKYFTLSICEVLLLSLNVIISIGLLKRENGFMTFCCQPHLLLKLVIQMIMFSKISRSETMEKSDTYSGYPYITL